MVKMEENKEANGKAATASRAFERRSEKKRRRGRNKLTSDNVRIWPAGSPKGDWGKKRGEVEVVMSGGRGQIGSLGCGGCECEG